MPKKKHKPEEIVAKLRQSDVLISQGQHIADVNRQIGVSEVTYYRWRQEYGGLKTEQVKRLKELETENKRSGTQHDLRKGRFQNRAAPVTRPGPSNRKTILSGFLPLGFGVRAMRCETSRTLQANDRS
jgi:transposase-like protein